MAAADETCDTGGSLSAIVVLSHGSEREFFNLFGFRICGARNCKRLFCGRLGRCPFHSQSASREQSELCQSTGAFQVETKVPPSSENNVTERSAEKETQNDQLGEQDTACSIPLEATRSSVRTSPARVSTDMNRTAHQRVARVLSDTELRRALESGNATIRVAGGRERMEQELSGPAALSFWDDWRVTNQPQQRTKRARFKKAWNLQEHARFLEALNMHGKGKWRDIAAWVGTRSAAQCQSHAQKFFDREQVRHQEHAHTEFADLPCSRAPLARKLRKRSIHDIRDPLLIRKELARQEDEQRAREERHARRAAAHERKLLHAKVSFIETRLRGHIERFVREHALTSPTKRLASNLRSNVQKCTQEWKASHMREQLASIEHASDKSETCGTEEELVPVVVMVPEDSLPTETKVFHLRKPLVLNMSDDAVSDTLDSHR